MPWYEDPKTGEEVCYTSVGNEYLLSDPKSRLYEGPHNLPYLTPHSPLQELSADVRFPDLGTGYKNV